MSIAKTTSTSDLSKDYIEGTKQAEIEAFDTEANDTKTNNTEINDTETSDTEFQLEQIEQAIAQITTGDFHHKWDSVRNFRKQFAHWGDRPISSLIERLNRSTDPENQWFLVRTLSHYDHPVVIETLASFLVATPVADLQIEATKALTQLGNSAIAILTRLIQYSATEKRILAARTLAKIRTGKVIEPLLSVANDADPQLRLIATEALGSFHDSRITAVLIQALEDESNIAIEAVRALGRRSDLLATTDLVEPLRQCLLKADETIAKESAIALGRLGTEPCTTVLGQFLTQPAPTRVKIAAVRALSWLNTPSSILYLATAFESPMPLVMPAVKQEIARALGQTDAPALKPLAAKPLVTWIKAVNTDKSNTDKFDTDTFNIENTFALKQAVISALSRIGSIETINSLKPLLNDDDARIRMHIISAIEKISPEVCQ